MKTLLNSVVLLAQKGHVGRSFWGVFCVSVALGDALLHLAFTCMYLVRDVQVFGLHLTKYHMCVVVQAACSVQGLLHWPVFILFGLDVLWSSRCPRPRPALTLVHTAVVFLLWTLSVWFVFTIPDSHPLTRDEDDHLALQHCHVMGGAQSRQVAWASLFLLVGTACYIRSGRSPNADRLRERLCHFQSTWSSFLLLLLFVLVSGTEVPPYLDMNAVWLCFIHSLHTAAALRSCSCVFCNHLPDHTGRICTCLTHTSHTHVCFLTDKSSFNAETLSAQMLQTHTLA
ncbi:putative G-protein coupled receptor 160 [Silurus asotus]|uniref:G-protein coupled receptor 160 n=1 Tax=Silurus asotus TaxID=30991 RepID=A0AAD5A479_SILAS|nr:putative G-protein coupled receptor 160 [Silurus asotus]